jgi:integrase
MVIVAAFAGLRRGECLGLARRHLDLEGSPGRITVERSMVYVGSQGFVEQAPKIVAGHRRVSMSDLVAAELRLHLQEYVGEVLDSLVFTSGALGATPTPTIWRRVWRKALVKAGVACTFHDLRHVAGTLNAAAGATIKESMAARSRFTERSLALSARRGCS